MIRKHVLGNFLTHPPTPCPCTVSKEKWPIPDPTHPLSVYLQSVRKNGQFLNPPTHSSDYVRFEWVLNKTVNVFDRDHSSGGLITYIITFSSFSSNCSHFFQMKEFLSFQKIMSFYTFVLERFCHIRSGFDSNLIEMEKKIEHLTRNTPKVV